MSVLLLIGALILAAALLRFAFGASSAHAQRQRRDGGKDSNDSYADSTSSIWSSADSSSAGHDASCSAGDSGSGGDCGSSDGGGGD